MEFKHSPSGTHRIIGDFRILREIGRGGMGVVYEAEQISLKRKVALKILPPHLSLSGEAVLKFRREAEAGGRQSHPGIVAVHAVGEEGGVHYIAQELVEGGSTLADRLEEARKKGAPRPPASHLEAAALAREIAGALHHAHRSGVIHRDVKPANILITPEGRPKVTDFGLARVEDALSLSRTGEFTGTPSYMSPEQAEGKGAAVDHRADIFSLGVTLFEMLTLELPFQGGTTREILKAILLKDPPDPRKVDPRIPRDLAVIVLKAMEKRPKDRYATMEEFAADLGRFLSGEVILARPSGPAARFVKRVKRNRAASAAWTVSFAALAAAVFLLVAGVFSGFDEEGFFRSIEAGMERAGGDAAALEKVRDALLSREGEITERNADRLVRLKEELEGAIRYARAAPAIEVLERVESGLGSLHGDRARLKEAYGALSRIEDLLPPGEWARGDSLREKVGLELSAMVLEDFLDRSGDRGTVTEETVRSFCCCGDEDLFTRARGRLARVLAPERDAPGEKDAFPAGGDFLFLRRETFSCGGVENEVDLYLHERTGLEFVLLPGGTFGMGSPGGEKGRKEREGPRHEVRVKPFFLCRTEVTQAAWRRVMGTAPWKGRMNTREGSDYPASHVNWNESKAFCSAAGLRLPSEAEWEYACRAGTVTAYFFGDSAAELGEFAWYDENTHVAGERYAHRVALKRPNAFGLFDMAGNLSEWTEDAMHESYSGAPADGSAWRDAKSPFRIVRGGAWFYYFPYCRSAYRKKALSALHSELIGFRPAADAP